MMIVTVCPTEATIDETLFTLGFASRVRNVSLNVARRNINAKSLEESLKVAKAEIREYRKKKVILEETVAELRKQVKKSAEKMTVQAEMRGKAVDEFKKSSEAQMQQLSKSNQELIIKMQEEKESRQKLQMESEALQKAVKKLNEQLRDSQKEKDRVTAILKQKEEREKEPLVLSHPATRTIFASAPSTQLGPPRREVFNAPQPRPARRITSISKVPEEPVGSNDRISTGDMDTTKSISAPPTTPTPSMTVSSTNIMSPLKVSSIPVRSFGSTTAASRNRTINRQNDLSNEEIGRGRQGSVSSITSGLSINSNVPASAPSISQSRTGRLKQAQTFSIESSASKSPVQSTSAEANNAFSIATIPQTTASSSSSSSSSTVALRTGMGARSKEALLRHQVLQCYF
jgi:myosin heavy subunit